VRAWIEARVRATTNPKRDAGYTRTALFELFETYAVENGYRKDRLPKCPEFIDRLAEDFPAIRHRALSRIGAFAASPSWTTIGRTDPNCESATSTTTDRSIKAFMVFSTE
jgi:hypothetical protein